MRDSMLYVSGQLNEQRYGPSFSTLHDPRFQLNLLHVNRSGYSGIQPPHHLSHEHQFGEGPRSRSVRLSRSEHQDAASRRDDDATASSA